MILVDSSVWIDYFNGRRTRETDLLDQLLDRDEVAIGDLMLAEVLQGFRRDGDFLKAEELLAELECLSMGGCGTARAAARHYRDLRARGITIRKTIDTLIAAFCLENHLPLLTADRDFAPYAEHLGLRLL